MGTCQMRRAHAVAQTCPALLAVLRLPSQSSERLRQSCRPGGTGAACAESRQMMAAGTLVQPWDPPTPHSSVGPAIGLAFADGDFSSTPCKWLECSLLSGGTDLRSNVFMTAQK